MKEAFLHYVWQFQYFDKRDLATVEGEPIQVIQPGLLNTHSGPDFSNAKVRIGPMSWAGTVEMHLKSSDWVAHNHETDKAYENVILHVVWHDDQPVCHDDGTRLPTLELKGRIPEALVSQYRKLVSSGFDIPCAQSLPAVPEIVKASMLDRTLIERLELKSLESVRCREANNGDWEETAYQLLARNFGFKVNGDPFHQLARHLPYKVLRKHIDHPFQVEALLFGMAGFLKEKIGDDYHRGLMKEYKILGAKYLLTQDELHSSQWKFLRMRPANFPTLRLAQFSALITARTSLFSALMESDDSNSLTSWMGLSPSAYWTTHYSFGKSTRVGAHAMGQASIENVIINTIAPLWVAYGKHRDEQHFVDRAVRILSELSAEENHITKTWKEAGWEVKNAFDAQALIQLFNSYCIQRQCLNCKIGAVLLKPPE